MKFFENSFEEYLKSTKKDLHPELRILQESLPDTMNKLKNMIFYGPPGVGKYTQVLQAIKKYSQSELKYEKKIIITRPKWEFNLKISDIHFEVDMDILGVNSKVWWYEIYNQIIDIISAKSENTGIIVCKNFQGIHSELLEIFYSYMQNINTNNISIKFILITQELSFIPENIITSCKIIDVKRPTKTLYNKCINPSDKDYKLGDISNIKNLKGDITQLTSSYLIISNKLIKIIINFSEIKLLNLRECIYDIFIYQISVGECIWNILIKLLELKHINNENLSPILLKTNTFLQYFNNNYRPIYHLEKYFLYIIKQIHGL